MDCLNLFLINFFFDKKNFLLFSTSTYYLGKQPLTVEYYVNYNLILYISFLKKNVCKSIRLPVSNKSLINKYESPKMINDPTKINN